MLRVNTSVVGTCIFLGWENFNLYGPGYFRKYWQDLCKEEKFYRVDRIVEEVWWFGVHFVKGLFRLYHFLVANRTQGCIYRLCRITSCVFLKICTIVPGHCSKIVLLSTPLTLQKVVHRQPAGLDVLAGNKYWSEPNWEYFGDTSTPFLHKLASIWCSARFKSLYSVWMIKVRPTAVL